jgi:hypothetical protein
VANKVVLCLVVVSVCLSAPVGATPILEVTGANDYTRVLLDEDAAAATFLLSAPISGLSISAELECFGCSAVAYLTTGLDVGFQPHDLVAAASVGSNPLFSGLDLDAGTYFLVIGNSAGALFWHASVAPVVTGTGEASRLLDWFADDAEAIAPASLFTPITGGGLHYELSRPDDVIPEPATACLLAISVAVILRRRRR